MSWSVLVGEHGITKRIRGCWGFCWGGHHRQCGQGRWDAPGSQVSVTAMRGIGAFSAYLWVAWLTCGWSSLWNRGWEMGKGRDQAREGIRQGRGSGKGGDQVQGEFGDLDKISWFTPVHAICQRPREIMTKRMHLQHLVTQDTPLDMSLLELTFLSFLYIIYNYIIKSLYFVQMRITLKNIFEPIFFFQ